MGLLDCDALVGLLAAADRNHSVIANNLANLNTPGCRTARLRFACQLEKVLDSRGGLLPGKTIQTEMFRPLFGNVGPDGNDVTLSREIAELNKNALRMNFYLGVLRTRIHRLRAAIEGR